MFPDNRVVDLTGVRLDPAGTGHYVARRDALARHRRCNAWLGRVLVALFVVLVVALLAVAGWW